MKMSETKQYFMYSELRKLSATLRWKFQRATFESSFEFILTILIKFNNINNINYFKMKKITL